MIDTSTCPIKHSEQNGRSFITAQKTNQVELGQYFTPNEIANYMASMLEAPNLEEVKILDPGAGSGTLASSAVKQLVENNSNKRIKKINVTLYELDKNLLPILTSSMNFLQKWCSLKSVDLAFKIKNKDYVLENASSLDEEPSFFRNETFDLVISNPPYFKIPKTDKRAIACESIIYGQPNIYSLFMAVAAAQLNPNGQFLFITPRSFATGQYFKSFRKYFFRKITLEKIHVFESRTDAFEKDSVLQENIITYGKRTNPSTKQIKIFSSSGKSDLTDVKHFSISSSDIINKKNDYYLALPANKTDANLLKVFDSWGNSLEKMGMKISTGPVVPFRATTFLKTENKPNTTPLLWIQHVLPMKTRFPLESFRKPQWIINSSNSKKLLVRNQNMVLMRRFSPKEDFRRLTVAPYLKNQFDCSLLGLENHLNYIYGKDFELEKDSVYGVAAFLNSKIFDSYFRITNGNTQVSATELRAVSLPEKLLLDEIGKIILKSKNFTHEEIDSVVNEVLQLEA